MKNIVVECKGLSRQQVNRFNTQNPKLQANAQNLKTDWPPRRTGHAAGYL
jgi:spore coat protein CotF